MLKHQDIINNLTTEQKLSLIADVTSLGNLPEAEIGFRFLKETSLERSEAWYGYPSFQGMVNSWDTALIGRVADRVLAYDKKNGTDVIELPNASFKISPYAEGVSEDPLISGTMVSEIALSGSRQGVATCMSDPSIKKEVEEYTDKGYCARTDKEFLSLPYKMVSNSKVKLLKVKPLDDKCVYHKSNVEFLELMKDRAVTVYDGADKGEFVKNAVNEGKFYVNGPREALDDAIENYEKLNKAFDACEIGLSDVNKACEAGSALSPEMIDRAVDRIISFTEVCRAVNQAPNGIDNAKDAEKKGIVKKLSVEAGEESIVLLKNEEETLPLKGGIKVALVGRVADGNGGLKEVLMNQPKGRRISFGGYVPGYGRDGDIGDKLADEAVKAVASASVVLLAVGYNQEQSEKARRDKNMRLPANQEALVNKICSLGKKVILLVYGDNPIDMRFDDKAQGVLLVPSGGAGVSEAIYNVLSGISCPGGRLANTRYDDTDKVFEDIKHYKDSGRNKVGVYYGYRLYDSSDIKVKYPFGFGLSYTKFTYSALSVRNGKVSVLVKNTGSKEGSEVVQFYVGKKDGVAVRAKKELKAFCKVRLKAGASRVVSVNLSALRLWVYDEKKGRAVIEDGRYELYACSSVSDVKLKTTFTIQGEKIEGKPFKKSDYLQTVGNIRDGKYYLEEPSKTPKYAYESARKFFVASSYTMIFFASIYLYLYLTGWIGGGIIGLCLFGGFTVLPIILASSLKKKKNNLIKNYIKKSKIMKKDKRSKINFDLLCESVPYEQLFIEEFDTPVIEVEKEEEVAVEAQAEDTPFLNETFEPDFTIQKATEELILYMKERGIYLDPDSARSLFASFASTRLVILNADDKELLAKFIDLLGKYFMCDAMNENFENIRAHGGDIINSSEYGRTCIANALMDPVYYRDHIRIMAVNGVASEEVKSLMQQVFRYLDQPEKEVLFSVAGAEGEFDSHYKVPHNIWFVLTLGEEEKAVDIPRYVLETACAIDLMIRAIDDDSTAKKRKAKMLKKEEVVIEPAVVEGEVAVTSENVEVAPQAEVVELEVLETPTQEAVMEVQAEAQPEAVEEEKTPVKLLTYYQFTKLVERAHRDVLLDETLWKRLDKLEDFIVGIDATYHINNKMWQRIEKYVSSFLSAGGSHEEALDNVVAHHVINTMIPSVATKKAKDSEKFSHTVENIFGEGHAPHSIKAIKSTGMKI